MTKTLHKNFFLFLVTSFSAAVVFAQPYTETFEGVNASPANQRQQVFVNNGQSFTCVNNTDCSIAGIFGIYIPGQVYANCNTTNNTNSAGSFGVGTNCTGGNCTGASNRFIDNGGVPFAPNGQSYSIKSTNNAAFTLQSFFLYIFTDRGNSPAAGGVTITGMRSSAIVFTSNLTAGLNTNFGSNNGYSYIDLSTIGVPAFSLRSIDEIRFVGGSTTNYIAVDNFQWGASTLPVQLLSFESVVKADKSVLSSWTTSAEVNNKQFTLERSVDGINYEVLTVVPAATSGAGAKSYLYTDAFAVSGNNYYRLKQTDLDGKTTILGVKMVTLATFSSLRVFPNPATTGKITISRSEAAARDAAYKLTDLNGRIVQSRLVKGNQQVINITATRAGIYLLQIQGNNPIKIIKR